MSGNTGDTALGNDLHNHGGLTGITYYVVKYLAFRAIGSGGLHDPSSPVNSSH